MALRKIAYLTPESYDKSRTLDRDEPFPSRLAKAIAARAAGRYEVDLIGFGRVAGRRQLAPGLTLRVLEASTASKDPYDVVSWGLPEVLAEADLVHIHHANSRCGEIGLLVAKQQRKPVCVTIYGGPQRTLGQELDVLRLADLVIAPSDFAAAELPVGTPVTIIKGGVDTTRWSPADKAIRRDGFVLFSAHGLDPMTVSPARPLIVCGRADRWHAFRRLHALTTGTRIKFVRTADEGRRCDLYRRARAVIFGPAQTGQTDDRNRFVEPAVLEAMACATPVIVARTGAMQEFVRPGVTGFLYDGPSDVSDQLRRLSSDPGLVETLGHNARLAVVREYNLAATAAMFMECYERLSASLSGVAA